MLSLSVSKIWLEFHLATPVKPQIPSSGLCEKKDMNPTIREGNGTPLQYSCLENPMDGGAW